ncbi:hypothetical protein [Massilia phyllosphaerae]|uniref:hypothetical protein n=1 Tax=Massilia phyllosphaerae TaxID=3106034 RepID=UPI002B1CDE79|nr:hypothetical protein [Massilia sp. SGZ-792]
MEAKDLAEQAKRTWGAVDAQAADRFMKLVSKNNPVPDACSDLPMTLPPDGQAIW